MSIINAIIKHIQGTLSSPATVENGQWCLNIDDSGGGVDLTELVLKDNSGVNHTIITEENIDSKISSSVTLLNESLFFVANDITEFKSLMESPQDIAIITDGESVEVISGTFELNVISSKRVYLNGKTGIKFGGGLSNLDSFLKFPTSSATNDIKIEFIGQWDTTAINRFGVNGGYSGNPYSYECYFESIDSEINDLSSGYVSINSIKDKESYEIISNSSNVIDFSIGAGGFGNSFAGFNSGNRTLTGQANSSFGENSLSGLTTGSYNTALGLNSGNNLSSGSNCILIGYNTQASSSSVSNELNIGNLIYGDLAGKKTVLDGHLSVSNLTPKTWNSSLKSIQLGRDTAITGGSSSSQTSLMCHLYNDGVFKFLGSDSTYGSLYQQDNGIHKWYSTSNAGVDGATATLVERMRLTQLGRLHLGTTVTERTVTQVRQTVNSGSTASYIAFETTASGSGDGNGALIGYSDSTGLTFYNYENTPIEFTTNGARVGGFSTSGTFDAITSFKAPLLSLFSSPYSCTIQVDTSNGDLKLSSLSGSVRTQVNSVGVYYDRIVSNYATGNTLYSQNYMPDMTTAGTGNPVYITSTGQLWENTSSRRFKSNERPRELNTESIFYTETKTYDRKRVEKVLDEDGKETGEEINVIVGTENGWIAEELYNVNPDFCTFDEDGVTPRGVHRDNVMVAIFEELKKLRAEVNELKAVK